MSKLVPVGVTGKGTLVVAAAIDYLFWDESAAAFAQRKELGGKQRRLLVAGKLSTQATRELDKAGWTVKSGLRS